MLSLPSSVEPAFLKFSSAFTQPTAVRMAVLMVGMILCRGRHTITAALRMVGSLADGHFSSYHRVFSRASWSTWTRSRILTRLILDPFGSDDAIPLAVDETTAAHKGAKVYGKGCHRDKAPRGTTSQPSPFPTPSRPSVECCGRRRFAEHASAQPISQKSRGHSERSCWTTCHEPHNARQWQKSS